MSIAMKPSLAAMAAALLGTGAAACGSAHQTASTKSTPTSSAGGYLTNDADNDSDDNPKQGFENDDNSLDVIYGNGANASDTRAVGVLVKSYLTAAAAGNWTDACALLDKTLAQTFTQAGGQNNGTNAISTCAQSVSRLFANEHPHLTSSDVATMTVFSVHVKGNVGIAELGFRTLPEQQLIVEREGSAWKVDAVLGNYLP